MITRFPSFSKLEIAHKQDVEAFTACLEPYSDFNFTNLWVWDLEHAVEVSELNNNLVVKMYNYNGEHMVLSIDGLNKIDESLAVLLDYAHGQNDVSNQLEYVHQNVVDEIKDRSSFEVLQERHNFDYVYSLKELSELNGSDYQRKRNIIKQFKQAHEGKIELRSLDITDSATKKQIIGVFEKWESSRSKERTETDDEWVALRRLLENGRDFSVATLGLYIDGKLEAFSINEPIHKDYAIWHFEKANTEFAGIFYFLRQEVAKFLLGLNVQYLNGEQDLGIAGLRDSKLGWHPIKFLEKYTVSTKV